MRILLALLSCLLLPCQFVHADEETTAPVVSESCVAHVFQDYEEALLYAREESIPLIIVLMSGTHQQVLADLVDEGLDLSDFFGFSLRNTAAIAVLHPDDSNVAEYSKLEDFKNRFPGSAFPEEPGVFMVTIVLDGEDETLLDTTPLYL
ncbi:hypothetical protein [Chlamydia caviae]|uniref:Uncharacterized protein n=1 Tax=Chlamydia caviae (strain ATCC VR-813 / DSM 19441 / 03DC25 / GPIC) TaxID=227941 RepID=Q821W1_CHLCV|nr:hypothetical protein [Chlamydia caviae]AAP05565.1 conserved hypothetical protein [Chlamydia caviae GPIC]